MSESFVRFCDEDDVLPTVGGVDEDLSEALTTPSSVESWAPSSSSSTPDTDSAADICTVRIARCRSLKPNTHRRRRRDSTVELSRVGGVNAPVGSRDPVHDFLC